MYQEGEWNEFPWDLKKERFRHVSWKRPDGKIILMGGSSSGKSTEIVTKDGSSNGFSLKYNTKSDQNYYHLKYLA